MKKRLIDADLLDAFLDNAELEARKQRRYVLASALNIIRGNLRNFQSIEPERKSGKWEKHFDGNEWFWCCSACKEQWYEEDLYMGGCDFPNYCPNCGSYNGGEE